MVTVSPRGRRVDIHPVALGAEDDYPSGGGPPVSGFGSEVSEKCQGHAAPVATQAAISSPKRFWEPGGGWGTAVLARVY